MAETVELTMGELDRLQVMTRIAERRLEQDAGARFDTAGQRPARRVAGRGRRAADAVVARRAVAGRQAGGRLDAGRRTPERRGVRAGSERPPPPRVARPVRWPTGPGRR